jgi:hypothetical protein
VTKLIDFGRTSTAASSAAITLAPSAAAFESAVAGLISSYIPSSVLIPLGSAVQSAAAAAGITGALTDIINSALAAPTPPPWITALPAAYQSNIQALESAISALKSSEALAPSGAPSPSSNATTSAVSLTSKALYLANPLEGQNNCWGTQVANRRCPIIIFQRCGHARCCYPRCRWYPWTSWCCLCPVDSAVVRGMLVP